MAEKRTCSSCGAEVPSEAPAGLCATCLRSHKSLFIWGLHMLMDRDQVTDLPVGAGEGPRLWPLPVTGETLRTHCGCGRDLSWEEARKWLSEWEAQGFLRVLRDPETAGKEVCVQLLYYINHKGCLPQFRKDLREHALANRQHWAEIQSLCE